MKLYIITFVDSEGAERWETTVAKDKESALSLVMEDIASLWGYSKQELAQDTQNWETYELDTVSGYKIKIEEKCAHGDSIETCQRPHK